MRPTLAALAGSIVVALTLAASVSARDSATFVVPCGDTIGNLSNPAGSDRPGHRHPVPHDDTVSAARAAD